MGASGSHLPLVCRLLLGNAVVAALEHGEDVWVAAAAALARLVDGEVAVDVFERLVRARLEEDAHEGRVAEERRAEERRLV